MPQKNLCMSPFTDHYARNFFLPESQYVLLHELSFRLMLAVENTYLTNL